MLAKSRKRKSSPFRGDNSATNDSEEEKSVHETFSDDEEGGIRVCGIYIPPAAKPHCSMDASGPRLIITHITNINFKSYAGKQVLGPFNKCFTAIIGPNGSGKSNVIDSMLFVFGYRASKIRSKKISVLLHNSEQHRDIQSCTVTVHFSKIIDKDGDDYETVPGSQFTVSRTASKDNSSYYEIDGRRVQFKEVAKLLRKHGIDLDHNRFLILQGEVEQIAMMKPKAQNEHETGMMEYLEDIIGTVRYKEPLVKLNEQMEILTEERQEKLNRVKIVEKEKDDLEQPMQTAIEFLKIENAKTRTKNLQIQKYIYEFESLIKEKNAEKEKINDQLKKANEELDNITAQKKEKEAFLHANNKQFEKLTKKSDSLKESFENATKLDNTLLAEAEQVNKKRKKTKELIREEKAKLQELEKVPEKNAREIETFETKEAKLVEQRDTIEEEKNSLLASMGAETAPLQEKKEKLEIKLVKLKSVVNDTKSAYDVAVSELNLYRKNEEGARDKLTRLQESYANVTETLKERRQAVKSFEKDVPKMEKELNELSQRLETERTEEQTAIMELRMKKATLESSRSAQQDAHSRNRVLNALVQAHREGSLPGFLGRLGDLGAIDLKYDVAVSTSCGALDNIVVETVETAEKCIDILKAGNVGRATFIALDKQEHLRRQAMTKISTPENAPRLFDLIRVTDERVKTAFYFALRDTLVANDLEQATRIAYGAKRYRVVSLGGDVIEIVGTMSGGGKSVCKGRMGQRVAVDTGRKSTGGPDLKKLENEIRQLETTLQETRDVQNEIGPKVADLKVQLSEMKMNLNKHKIEMESLVKQLPVIQDQIKRQEKIASTTLSDPAQVKKLQAVVDETKTAYEEARNNASGLEEQVNELTEQINGKTRGRMKVIDAKLKDCIKNIDKFRTEITRLKIAIKTAERNTKKSNEKIVQMEQDLTEAEHRILKIVEERKEIEGDCAKMLKESKEIQEQLSALEDNGIKAEIAQLTKDENELKTQKIAIEYQYTSVKTSIKEAQAQIPDLRLKLSQLELHKIPREKTVEELKVFTEEDFEKVDQNQLHYELTAQDDKLRNFKPNLAVIKEYNRLEEVYMQRISELEKITNKRQELREHYEKLRKRRNDEFLIGFQIITAKLKEMYQMITLGGDAELELVDSLDPFSEGVTFSVRPPKKSWKNISNLSGGEKTLSSLALVFALHYYKPSPLYVMDEIDAALDFKNVSIVGNYIKDRTKNAQFIIISLRSNMFELADHLVGIYKTYNCTKSITVNPCLYPPPMMPSQIGSSVTAYSQQTQRPNGTQPLSQIPNPQPKI